MIHILWDVCARAPFGQFALCTRGLAVRRLLLGRLRALNGPHVVTVHALTGELVETQGTFGSSLPAPPPRPPAAAGVELRVSRRLLWVGEAAYPLHNITRVHTFVLRPKRMEALNDFLKWTAITAVVFVILQVLNQNASSYSSRDDSAGTLWVLGVAVVIGLFLRMLKVWTAPN